MRAYRNLSLHFKLSLLAGQIDHASEQQSSVSDEINRNIVEISNMTEHSPDSTEQISTAGQDLARLASELVCDQFR